MITVSSNMPTQEVTVSATGAMATIELLSEQAQQEIFAGVWPSITINEVDDTSLVTYAVSTVDITKNIPLAISSPNTKAIAYVSVFDPVTNNLLMPQAVLASNRLSGSITISKDITDAILTIFYA